LECDAGDIDEIIAAGQCRQGKIVSRQRAGDVERKRVKTSQISYRDCRYESVLRLMDKINPKKPSFINQTFFGKTVSLAESDQLHFFTKYYPSPRNSGFLIEI
jgi:hypothetical protein